MSKKLFTDNEIKLLSENKYTKNVTNKTITYTEEFKILFITERSKGKLPIHIFQDAGFDIELIGNNRIWPLQLSLTLSNTLSQEEVFFNELHKIF